MRGFSGRALLVALALLAIAFAADGAELAQGPRILSIAFEGNEHLGAGALRGRMRLRQPAWWRPFSHPRYPGSDFLAADLHAVLGRYGEAGYPLARVREAEVTYGPGDENVRILIRLDEGPRIYLAGTRLPGLDPGWVKEFHSKAALKRGRPISVLHLDADRTLLGSLSADKGHPLVRVDQQLEYRGDSVNVVFRVDPGPEVRVGSVVVDNVGRSRPAMVLRELTLREGDLLTSRRLQDSQDRLLGTGVFQRVRIEPLFIDSVQGVAALRVRLEERKLGWYGGGAGYSSDRLRFLTEWGIRNLTGMGRRLSFTGNLYYALDSGFRWSGIGFKEGRVQFDYLEPWLLGTRTRGSVSPYLDWLRETTFRQRTLGYTVALSRDVSRTGRVSLGFESKRVQTTEPGVVPLYTTRSIRSDYTDDRRNNFFDPSTGRYQEAVVDYAGGGLLGGTNEFGRVSLTLQGYASPRPRWVLAARFKAGYIHPFGLGPLESTRADTLRISHVPWEERFRLGGGTTIRGYPEAGVGRQNAAGEAIGGLVLVLSNFEVRFPVVSIVQGGLFLDMGNVWAEPSELKLSHFTRGFTARTYNQLDVAVGAGAGLRLRTPVGPFRFDYGFRIGSGRAQVKKTGELHVALGQAF